jgi:hypothetical protein
MSINSNLESKKTTSNNKYKKKKWGGRWWVSGSEKSPKTRNPTKEDIEDKLDWWNNCNEYYVQRKVAKINDKKLKLKKVIYISSIIANTTKVV